MLTGIDHVVIGVRDLDEATRNYGELGFTVVAGGRHPTGTHNALIGFADGAYLELIAFERPAPEHRWWQWVQNGGGLTDVCLRTDDLAADVAAFRRAGIKMEDPSPLSRVRPDGYKLEWKLAIPEANGSGVIPFLIEDETPREERVPRETSHANHVIGIKGLVIGVENLNEIARLYTQALNSSLGPVERRDIAAAGTRFIAGPHTFEIVSPTVSRGALACWLKERGPSIYSLSLSSSQGERRSLDEHSALGARIQIERRRPRNPQ